MWVPWRVFQSLRWGPAGPQLPVPSASGEGGVRDPEEKQQDAPGWGVLSWLASKRWNRKKMICQNWSWEMWSNDFLKIHLNVFSPFKRSIQVTRFSQCCNACVAGVKPRASPTELCSERLTRFSVQGAVLVTDSIFLVSAPSLLSEGS